MNACDTIGGLPTSFSSLTAIAPHEWDRLAGDNAFASYGWLLVLIPIACVPPLMLATCVPLTTQ